MCYQTDNRDTKELSFMWVDLANSLFSNVIIIHYDNQKS